MGRSSESMRSYYQTNLGLDYRLKGEGNFQNNLSWFKSSPPLLPKYIGEKAHNAPKVKL